LAATGAWCRHCKGSLRPAGRKVCAVVDHGDFSLDVDLTDGGVARVRALVGCRFPNVTRYRSPGFLRAKRGRALAARGVAPQLVDSAAAARQQRRGD
jgi:propionate CoA-transferase